MGCYANYFEVGHNAYEFLVDFGQFRPESKDVALHTRIVVGPTHAKLLSKMLLKAVRQHEKEHGPIAEMEERVNPPNVPAGMVRAGGPAARCRKVSGA